MKDLHWMSKEQVLMGSTCFKEVQDILNLYQYGALGSNDNAKKRSEYKARYKKALVGQQPLGEAMLADARQVVKEIHARLELPNSYSTSFAYDIDRPFIANNTNTPSDLSVFFSNKTIAPMDDNQIHGEIRVRVDSPAAFIFFTVGSRYGFLGKQIKLADGKIEADTFEELLEVILNVLQEGVNKQVALLKLEVETT